MLVFDLEEEEEEEEGKKKGRINFGICQNRIFEFVVVVIVVAKYFLSFFCISICLINLLREKKKYTKQPKMCNSFDRIPHTHSHRIAQGRERDYYCKALKQNKRKEEKKKQQQKRGALI